MNTVLITGATSGIGLASALELAKRDFRVLLAGRDEAHTLEAKSKVLSQVPNADVVCFTADLLQQREVHRLADEVSTYLKQSGEGELYALISNAGCVRSWHTTTEEGYEQQFALNHLAGFLLTYRLLPFLIKANGRVILTGSESHKHMRVRWNDVMFTKAYHPLLAYKQSKLCNILFAKALNDRYAGAGLRAYTVDPGLVCTEIGCKNTGGLVGFVWKKRMLHGAPPGVPARTYAFLCAAMPAPEGLYYHDSRKQTYSKQVTSENAARLFALSERLCGIRYPEESEGWK